VPVSRSFHRRRDGPLTPPPHSCAGDWAGIRQYGLALWAQAVIVIFSRWEKGEFSRPKIGASSFRQDGRCVTSAAAYAVAQPIVAQQDGWSKNLRLGLKRRMAGMGSACGDRTPGPLDHGVIASSGLSWRLPRPGDRLCQHHGRGTSGGFARHLVTFVPSSFWIFPGLRSSSLCAATRLYKRGALSAITAAVGGHFEKNSRGLVSRSTTV